MSNFHITQEEIKKWNDYDEKGLWKAGYTSEDLLNKFLVGVSGRVLDLGCGRGEKIGCLDGNFKKFGIDASENAIALAKQSFPDVEFFVADACKLPFPDNHFDFIFSLEVIEHIDSPRQMLLEIKRVLKPGCFCLIQTPNYPVKRFYDFLHWMRGTRKSFRDDYTHVFKFGVFGLKKLIARYFEIILLRTRNIIGENKINFLKIVREKGGLFSLLFGQKTIVVFKKHVE